MQMREQSSITQLLHRLREGDKQTLDELIPLVYAELRRLAGGYLRGERQGHTLQPTALVHEAYLRLVGQDQPEYKSRSHFYGVAAHVMRQILVDHARRVKAAKRGNGIAKVPLREAMGLSLERADTVVALDDALEALRRFDERKAKLVEMRFFGGLTAEESGEVLEMPVSDVRREWRLAQAWLQREMDRPAAAEE
jgi:RNA polymerase sigma factor (TIGR02999 family)